MFQKTMPNGQTQWMSTCGSPCTVHANGQLRNGACNIHEECEENPKEPCPTGPMESKISASLLLW